VRVMCSGGRWSEGEKGKTRPYDKNQPIVGERLLSRDKIMDHPNTADPVANLGVAPLTHERLDVALHFRRRSPTRLRCRAWFDSIGVNDRHLIQADENRTARFQIEAPDWAVPASPRSRIGVQEEAALHPPERNVRAPFPVTST
jgi:hypothetical protein